jgi:thiol-disulfide isomerase/thioredoxin
VLSMSVTGGVIAVDAVVVAATVLGLALRRRAGRFRPGPAGTGGKAAGAQHGTLTEADLGRRLGERPALVQFSTAFCAPCRPARQILAQVAGMVDGVTHVDIKADVIAALGSAVTSAIPVDHSWVKAGRGSDSRTRARITSGS